MIFIQVVNYYCGYYVSLDIHDQDVIMIRKPGMFTVSRLIKVLIDTKYQQNVMSHKVVKMADNAELFLRKEILMWKIDVRAYAFPFTVHPSVYFQPCPPSYSYHHILLQLHPE